MPEENNVESLVVKRAWADAESARPIALIVWGALQGGAILWLLLAGRPALSHAIAWVSGIVIPAAAYLYLRLLPTQDMVFGLSDEGLRIPLREGRETRLIPWHLVSGAECHLVRTRNSYRYFVRIRCKALSWDFDLGPEESERVRAAVTARLLPDAGTRSDRLTVSEYFELFFDVILPASAVLKHGEYHAETMSGLWSLSMPREIFPTLFTKKGLLSEWYPLTADQRFRIGDATLAGGSDLHGVYAIGLMPCDSTPVLVWDANENVLHAILTRSMG